MFLIKGWFYEYIFVKTKFSKFPIIRTILQKYNIIKENSYKN